MKSVHPALQADLDAGSTTLCRCWRLVRGDGRRLGFTDHDADLTSDGTVFLAAAGLTASALESTLGMTVDGGAVAGALISDALTEDDLARGLWDNAAVTIFLVDWRHPERRATLFSGSIGEVSRGASAFSAELRSLSHRLNQPQGRLYGRLCDADFGDARCGMTIAAWTAAGTVTDVAGPKSFACSGLGTAPEGRFRGGRLAWTGGANAGLAMEVRTHGVDGGTARLALFADMPAAPAAGDTFTVSAGCNKTIAMCKQAFGNVVNFRGFPDMPGNDWLLSPPSRKDRKHRRRRRRD